MSDPQPANKRSLARLASVQALYQMDISGTSLMRIVSEYENFRLGQEIDGEQYADADEAWFRHTVSGVVQKQRVIDPLIHDTLPENWSLARMETTLRAILRCATLEFLARKDVPAKVIISEYVEVTKAFFEGDEPRLVNAVLDNIARQRREGELDEASAQPAEEELETLPSSEELPE